MMLLFIFINDVNANNSSYAIEELDMYKVNKNAIEYIIAVFIKSLDFIFKE